MSLGIVIKGPEGLVLAADSRITLQAQPVGGQPAVNVNYDTATKLLSFSEPNTSVGVVTYGQALIGIRTAHSYIPEFEASLPPERLSVSEFARLLSEFYGSQFQSQMPGYTGPDMTFVVGGFNEDEPYGRVFEIKMPSSPTPIEHQAGPGDFGITWGGQREIVDRLLQGYDYRLPDILRTALKLTPAQQKALLQQMEPLRMSIPLQALPLQDCVDLAIFFIRTTINAQNLIVGLRGVGGPIEVATVTRREGLQFVQKKRIVGESQS
jgi:hypothetical protein